MYKLSLANNFLNIYLIINAYNQIKIAMLDF